jgi:hypothetical protein
MGRNGHDLIDFIGGGPRREGGSESFGKATGRGGMEVICKAVHRRLQCSIGSVESLPVLNGR